jgi:hypothetical protein
MNKEEALEYIRNRYPEQSKIHADYLKPREQLVVPKHG